MPRSQVARLLAVGLIGLALFGALAAPTRVFSAEPVRFSISIHGRKVDAAQKTIRTIQGAAVELTFATDEAVELHLHGYDQYVTVQPGATSVMRLEAKIAGRFSIEAHRFGGGRSHVVLLYLEVHPR